MPVEQCGSQPELPADGAHFIFIERCQRLDDAAFLNQALNPGDPVVMGLDEFGLGGPARFNGVGVNGALAENPAAVQEIFRLENAPLNAHELFADDVALDLWLDRALKSAQELFGGILNRDGARAQGLEVSAHEFGFALAHQAGVDVGSMHTVRPQRPQAQRVGYRRIHAAAYEKENLPVFRDRADLILDCLHLTSRIPILDASTGPEYEISENLRPAGSVRDFRMKLHRIQTALGRGHGGDRAGGGTAKNVKAVRRSLHGVAVAHPDLLAAGDATKQPVGTANIQLGEPVLATIALFHAPAQDVSHQLLPVADSEYRNAAGKQTWIDGGASGI